MLLLDVREHITMGNLHTGNIYEHYVALPHINDVGAALAIITVTYIIIFFIISLLSLTWENMLRRKENFIDCVL